MCCFSAPVEDVSDTRIFARSTKGGRQLLVYQMYYAAKSDLAMILPLPVSKNIESNDVEFLNLKGYPEFFDDLAEGFPARESNGDIVANAKTLPVQDVGNFLASFAPKLADLNRLDPRFRLPARTWEKLPTYRDFGFAVFQLKSKDHAVHPMALDFPRRNPKELFFPTVHIHDGEVHAAAEFDHTLYAQNSGPDRYPLSMWGWEESPEPAAAFVKVAKTEKIIEPRSHVYRKSIVGRLKNTDIVLA